MQYLILLDSSNTSLTVGLAKDGVLLEEISYEAWQEQSEHMIPELNKLLEKYEVDRNLINGIIVSNGPGSYTGVRISITIAKTIALALSCKVYPVSSLRVLKYGKKPSICVINARSKRSYVGVYEDKKIIIKDTIMTNEDVMKYIDEHPNYTVCGNADYLNIKGYKASVSSEMLSLIDALEPIENHIGLSPIYMKD